MSSPGLEVVPQYPGLEPVQQVAAYPEQGPQFYDKPLQNEAEKTSNGTRQVCGLNRKTFWILVATAVVIITAAALGGGLGGGLSQRTQNPQEQTSSMSTSMPLTTPTSTSTPSSTTGDTTTSSVVSPLVTAEVGTINGKTVTLYRDCPSTNDTYYSVQLHSMTYQFRKLCNMQAININGITAYVDQPTADLNDCINLCAAWNENNVTKSNADQLCSSVCWRNGFANDDFPGQCFGFMANNASVSGGFNLQTDAICDSAIWINQG